LPYLLKCLELHHLGYFRFHLYFLQRHGALVFGADAKKGHCRCAVDSLAHVESGYAAGDDRNDVSGPVEENPVENNHAAGSYAAGDDRNDVSGPVAENHAEDNQRVPGSYYTADRLAVGYR
jgi:hypothetical protein